MAVTTTFEDQHFGMEFLAQILDYIQINFVPDDVFTDEQLKEWALDNDFVEE